MKTLILGIGNILLSDEGIGVHTLNYLQTHYGHLNDINYVDGGTLSFTLAPAIEEAHHLIVIDAARLQAEAGTIQTFIDTQMDDFLSTPQRSVHEISLIDLLTIVRLTERLPQKRALIGIQPQKLNWGDVPSPKVAQSIPQAATVAIQLLKKWGHQI
jgi:hydrogenase maturation protease